MSNHQCYTAIIACYHTSIKNLLNLTRMEEAGPFIKISETVIPANKALSCHMN